jgi:hypothetical protein
VFAGACALLTLAGACSGDSSVETPTSATATTVAEATITESFEDGLSVGGEVFYSFSVTQYGTVNVTLAEVGGSQVPATVWVGLGLGTPSGTDCTTTSTINIAAGTGPHLTTTSAAGIYCAKIWDIGNLYGPARCRIEIAHP